MKSKLMLASMILLASLSASAQKIYTGVITFPNSSTTYEIDNVDNLNTDEVEKGKNYLYKIVKAAYGEQPYNYRSNNSNSARTLKAIVIEPLNQALQNPFIKNLPKNKGNIVVYGQLTGSKYGGTALVTDLCIVNVKNQTIFFPETGHTKIIKP